MKLRQTQLFRYCAEYRTPSGKKVYVNGVTRGRLWNDQTTLEREAKISACANICANPKRRVLRGVDSIKITRLEPISPIHLCPYE
jgi:hypothetical protein